MDEIFSFLIVRNSGHLLPMDLPATALEMIDRFINGRTFADVSLPSERSYRLPNRLSAPAPITPGAKYQQSNAFVSLVLTLLAAGAIACVTMLSPKRSIDPSKPAAARSSPAYSAIASREV